MRPFESQSSTGSPVKHVEFQRGNSRVVPSLALSPRAALLRRRPGATPQKYKAAQQQSRKPSNPIAKTKLDVLEAPKLDPPTDGLVKLSGDDDDEWQDVDLQPGEAMGARPARLMPLPNTHYPGSPKDRRNNTSTAAQQESQSTYKQHEQQQHDTSTADTTETSSSTQSTSTSFLGFSPSAARASFIRKLGKQGRKFKPASWTSRWSEGPHTPDEKIRGSASYASGGVGGYGYHSGSKFKSFWLDPATPGLLALYLQVGFNLAMVSALIYAIIMFYLTIRSDVNLKVEEYSVDIVDQIAKCSFEYLRNGCEPSKRVPAIEAACQQWERCMQRDPKEVGRAKVSAETFGTIIEAFLRPIGIKSMIFLVAVFAGSFLLINAVFASRIGPRFAGDFSHQFAASHSAAPPPPAAPQYQPQVAYAQPPPPQSSFLYSPSPRIVSPRHRQPSLHATLQSSPLHHQAYVNFPY